MADFESWLARNKSLWSRVYDEVILPDIEKEWKKRTEDEKGFTTSGPQQAPFEEHITSSHQDEQIQALMLQNAHLQEDNTDLKSSLEDKNVDLVQRPGEDDPSPVDLAEYARVTKQLDELTKRLGEASRRIKYLERKNVAVMQKNKEMKESVKAWQEYCDRHLKKQKTKVEGKSTSPHIDMPPVDHYPTSPSRATSGAVTPMAGPRSPSPHESVRASAGIEFGENDVRTIMTKDRSDAHVPVKQEELVEQGTHSLFLPPASNLYDRADVERTSSGLNKDQLGSSQTTADDTAANSCRLTMDIEDQADDDEEPVFVSERNLKRKRVPSKAFDIYNDGSSDGTPAKPLRVKEELYSSPIQEPLVNQLLRKETMDLDELGPNPILTPRRRARRRFDPTQHSKHAPVRNERSSSAPYDGNIIKTEPITDIDVTPVRPNALLPVDPQDTRALSEPRHPSTHREALQPIDSNAMPARACQSAPDKRIKREDARSDAAFELLESGEKPPHRKQRVKPLPPSLAREHFNERIRAAKSGQSPLKNAMATPKTAPTKTSTAHIAQPSPSIRSTYTPSARPAQRKAFVSAQRREVVPDGRPVWGLGAATEPTREVPPPRLAKDARSQGPLRSKPTSELQIQDFKPNPEYNQGYTYAFSETVRKRNDRLCLPGCTNPSCCGSVFRNLASAAAPLSLSQEEKLLQDYLGDAHDRFGLTQMSTDEKDEIVLQARTWKMAMENGKHRQAYEGRKTPPGFWRVDFPTTQEAEEDREKAAAMEQNEVRARYLEAMRPGGKWIFWDE